ncbi:type I polyketide synthase, partial [Streptomyces sp. SID3343]|nr:type I polyketide synthase [Streptomyces sp. SID3343]
LPAAVTVEAAGAVGAAGAAAPARDAVLLEYLAAAREAVAAQRDVLLGYLGVAGGVAPPAAPGLVASGLGAVPAAAVVVDEPPALVARAPAGPVTRADVLRVVLDIVGTRTGYPEDMLDPTLDLEADLSIDSIKRTEIIGELAVRLRLPGAEGAVDEAVVERLAKVKTINGIVDDVVGFASGPSEPPAEPTTVDPTAVDPATVDPADACPAPADAPAAPAAARPTRHVVECVPVEDPSGPGSPGSLETPEEGPPVAGRRVVLVEDGAGVAWALTELLEAHGAEVESTRPGADVCVVEGADTLVHLAALGDGQDPVLPGAFPLLRAALLGGVRQVFLVTAGGGHFGRGPGAANGPDPVPGAGLAGFARAAALEFPDRVVRVVDVDPKEEPELIARRLLAEARRAGGTGQPVTIGLSAQGRRTLRPRPSPLSTLDPTDRDALLRTRLGPDSVVLLTGGARGITAQAALGLARATGCRLELLGRTGADPTPEDPA